MPYSTWWITRTMVIFLLSRNITVYAAVVAEWLRRLTRNQIPSGSAGSNPADCEFFSRIVRAFWNLSFYFVHLSCVSIVGSVVECSPATRAARVRFPDDAANFFVC